MATQIASAMRHMEYVGLVHGDLAARNCLVGDGLTVKVSDLGVARSLHAADYCPIGAAGGPALPLRWMAWESVVLVSLALVVSSLLLPLCVSFHTRSQKGLKQWGHPVR